MLQPECKLEELVSTQSIAALHVSPRKHQPTIERKPCGTFSPPKIASKCSFQNQLSTTKQKNWRLLRAHFLSSHYITNQTMHNWRGNPSEFPIHVYFLIPSKKMGNFNWHPLFFFPVFFLVGHFFSLLKGSIHQTVRTIGSIPIHRWQLWRSWRPFFPFFGSHGEDRIDPYSTFRRCTAP